MTDLNKELHRIFGHSYQIIESSFSQKFYYASLWDRLKEGPQWVNCAVQQKVQIKWYVSVHGRDMYLLKPTLGPPKRFRHLTRAEEVVITRLRIGHTKATNSHILSQGPPTACQPCDQTLTIEHILLECTVLQQSRDDWIGLDLFNDYTHLSGHISNPTQVNVSQELLLFSKKLLKFDHTVHVWGLVEVNKLHHIR